MIKLTGSLSLFRSQLKYHLFNDERVTQNWAGDLQTFLSVYMRAELLSCILQLLTYHVSVSCFYELVVSGCSSVTLFKVCSHPKKCAWLSECVRDKSQPFTKSIPLQGKSFQRKGWFSQIQPQEGAFFSLFCKVPPVVEAVLAILLFLFVVYLLFYFADDNSIIQRFNTLSQ